VSKRHQSSRRKAYGRRQHELRERTDRHHVTEPSELTWDDMADTSAMEPFAFLDPRAPRLRLVFGD
jgi:hypothetical protein